jgi:drug/metabolite transporter (DMT)-like permease
VSAAPGGFRDPRVLLPFLLITLIWSSTWIVIKGQLGTVPPIWSVSYRFLLSAATMLATARLAGVRIGLDRRGHGLALLLGIFQFVLNYNLVYAAELYVTSGLVAVVFALLIVPNAAMARLFFGARVGGRFALGSAVALAGVALLFVQEVRAAGAAPRAVTIGLGCTLVGVLAASCGNVMQLLEAVKARSIAAMLGWAMLYGGLIDAALAWALYGPPVFEPHLLYWLELLYLSIVASALAFWLYSDHPRGRPGARRLFERADPDRRDGDLDLRRTLCLVADRHGRRPARPCRAHRRAWVAARHRGAGRRLRLNIPAPVG